MAVVLVTGMSGTGKSAVLGELARRGHRVVDTDYDGWCEYVTMDEWPGWEQLWREDRIDALLDEHAEGTLFISGTVRNQGKFYPRFDAVVLLSAPLDVILERVATRDTNPYGKTGSQRQEIEHHLATVEPLLRAGATAEIDTRKPLTEVADELEAIANMGTSPQDSGPLRYDEIRRFITWWRDIMKTKVHATFDGKAFRPDNEIDLPPNTRVTLTIETPSDGETSFLATARSLQLDGPPDWSERLDDYLYNRSNQDEK